MSQLSIQNRTATRGDTSRRRLWEHSQCTLHFVRRGRSAEYPIPFVVRLSRQFCKEVSSGAAREAN